MTTTLPEYRIQDLLEAQEANLSWLKEGGLEDERFLTAYGELKEALEQNIPAIEAEHPHLAIRFRQHIAYVESQIVAS